MWYIEHFCPIYSNVSKHVQTRIQWQLMAVGTTKNVHESSASSATCRCLAFPARVSRLKAFVPLDSPDHNYKFKVSTCTMTWCVLVLFLSGVLESAAFSPYQILQHTYNSHLMYTNVPRPISLPHSLITNA